ncbi:MAG TPA: glyoxalase [Chloroflexi bacterium]|nr:glyoxalase [Chloroflexota bacterium]
MTIRRVVPNFRSAAPAESRAFYVDFLGFDVGMDMGWIVTFVSTDNPTAQLSIISEDPRAHIHPDCSVQVSDVSALYDRALAQGMDVVYPMTDEPWGVRRFFVTDPNGRVINVLQHIEAGSPQDG